jgi:hypothetical protein
MATTVTIGEPCECEHNDYMTGEQRALVWIVAIIFSFLLGAVTVVATAVRDTKIRAPQPPAATSVYAPAAPDGTVVN